jgi:hypothetical protein
VKIKVLTDNSTPIHQSPSHHAFFIPEGDPPGLSRAAKACLRTMVYPFLWWSLVALADCGQLLISLVLLLTFLRP